jgi:hypothetical protein
MALFQPISEEIDRERRHHHPERWLDCVAAGQRGRRTCPDSCCCEDSVPKNISSEEHGARFRFASAAIDGVKSEDLIHAHAGLTESSLARSNPCASHRIQFSRTEVGLPPSRDDGARARRWLWTTWVGRGFAAHSWAEKPASRGARALCGERPDLCGRLAFRSGWELRGRGTLVGLLNLVKGFSSSDFFEHRLRFARRVRRLAAQRTRRLLRPTTSLRKNFFSDGGDAAVCHDRSARGDACA